MHGFRSTHRGNPLDTYGRNIYLDTFNSSYGSGWRRENGFLARKPTGGFCYGLWRGGGQAYRAAVVGPGVTPDVFWESRAPGPFDLTRELAANAEQRRYSAHPAADPAGRLDVRRRPMTSAGPCTETSFVS